MANIFSKYNCVKKQLFLCFYYWKFTLSFKKPVVTISQNLLPFSKNEIKKYFFSSFYLKLKLLGFTQSLSFKLSEGVIFLHKYSKKFILKK